MKKIILLFSIVFSLVCIASEKNQSSESQLQAQCVVEYTIAKDGNVKDVQIVMCEPEGKGFEQESIRAAKKIKYKPKIVDGKAVEVHGVRYSFKYLLDDS